MVDDNLLRCATMHFCVRHITAYCLLLTAYCLLPTAYCLLPTAYCLLPTAYCLLLTAFQPFAIFFAQFFSTGIF